MLASCIKEFQNLILLIERKEKLKEKNLWDCWNFKTFQRIWTCWVREWGNGGMGGKSKENSSEHINMKGKKYTKTKQKENREQNAKGETFILYASSKNSVELDTIIRKTYTVWTFQPNSNQFGFLFLFLQVYIRGIFFCFPVYDFASIYCSHVLSVFMCIRTMLGFTVYVVVALLVLPLVMSLLFML